MTSLLRNLICGLISLGVMFSGIPPAAAAAVGPSLCSTGGVAFLFFNGVQTTKEQADVALQQFKAIHGSKTPQGDTIRYESFYNQTNGFEDFVETFEQRLNEQGGLLQGRFELFFGALKGDGPWWSTIINTVGATADILKGIVDLAQAAAVRSLTALLANPPTQLVYQEHRSRLDNLTLEGKKLLLVAHSQGNLFVNPAYTYATTIVSSASARVVHIAPASPMRHGDYTLANLDLVINALRLAGSVDDNTDSIPGYLMRSPGVNGKRDALGHGLLEIYLNPTLTTASRIKAQIDDAFSALVAPPAVAQSGFFSATLTWDGLGDVDLHTVEPSGFHVFYRVPVGSSGYLDVDNMFSSGPEHYYASCDASQLQEGSYKISVANWARAQGRTATVQIASWADGVLGTKSVVLGDPTGDTPSVLLFNVIVTKNAQTGSFNVELGATGP